MPSGRTPDSAPADGPGLAQDNQARSTDLERGPHPPLPSLLTLTDFPTEASGPPPHTTRGFLLDLDLMAALLCWISQQPPLSAQDNPREASPTSPLPPCWCLPSFLTLGLCISCSLCSASPSRNSPGQTDCSLHRPLPKPFKSPPGLSQRQVSFFRGTYHNPSGLSLCMVSPPHFLDPCFSKGECMEMFGDIFGCRIEKDRILVSRRWRSGTLLNILQGTEGNDGHEVSRVVRLRNPALRETLRA